MTPALVNIKLSNSGQIVYDENLPFRAEPDNESITDFINFIRPNLKFNYILYSFVRDLKQNEI
jgi:hypothetical protein